MTKIELHSEIVLVKNFMNKQQCDFFIEKGELVCFEEAKVNIDGRQIKMKGLRNNQRIMFKDGSLANSIWSKIAPYVPKSYEAYTASGLNELFRIYKYTQDQRFKMHRDGSYVRSSKECSFFSFLIYLNDDYTGGETYFEEGITVTPELGDALLFRHPLKHEGKTIISGTK